MMFAYRSGEDIMPGDSIAFHGDAGTVEFVVNAARPGLVPRTIPRRRNHDRRGELGPRLLE